MHDLSTTQTVGGTMTDEQILDMWQDLNNAFCRRDAPRDTPLIVQFARALLAASEASAEPDAYERAMADAIITGTGMVKVEYVAPADYAALHLTPEQAAKEAK